VEGKIACNEARLEFYSDQRCKWFEIGKQDPVAVINGLKVEGYTSFLLWIHRKDERLRSAIAGDSSLVLEREFPGSKGSRVNLYAVRPERR
jgi:hypothetical protein